LETAARLFTITIIAMVALGLYFHRWFEEQHLNKLAIAGLLKTHPVTAAAVASATAYMPQFPAVPMHAPPKRPPPPKLEERKERKKELLCGLWKMLSRMASFHDI